MIQDLLFLAVGGLLLWAGAEGLVAGASGIARRFGLSELVIGLTVVSWGTSAPEFAVSGLAAFEGQSAIALGNVIGSNIANLGVILGVTTLISPPHVSPGLAKLELPALALTALFVPILLANGEIERWEGALLLVAAAWLTRRLLVSARTEAPGAGPAPAKPRPLALQLLFVLGGLALLVGGGKLLVDGAVGLARAVGMSDRMVGLTVVAIGTSLPELAASLVAAFRGSGDLAVGNVLGSNIFNVLLILGGAAAIAPIQGQLGELRVDLAAMLLFTVGGTLMLLRQRRLTRLEGGLLVGGYGVFVALLVRG